MALLGPPAGLKMILSSQGAVNIDLDSLIELQEFQPPLELEGIELGPPAGLKKVQSPHGPMVAESGPPVELQEDQNFQEAEPGSFPGIKKVQPPQMSV